MALLGTLVKAGVELGSKLVSSSKTPEEYQLEQLLDLLKTAKNTAFGKYYGFEEIIKSENPIAAFRENIPLFDYDKIDKEWWSQQQKFPDITWPGSPEFYALSSGTTGKTSKRIPITEDFLKSMRNVGKSLLTSLPNFDLPEELFESEVLMLSSSANLSKHEKGHLEGEISGINVSNFPGWYDYFYRPGNEIAAIDDWNERVTAIVEKAPEWNIGAIAGIPSWVLEVLKAVKKKYNLQSIKEIWPNLTTYVSGGVAFETYRKDFEELCGTELVVIDTYLASEGFFSYGNNPDSLDMELALSHGYYYEFIPFDKRGVDESGSILENPVIFSIDQVDLDTEYILVISTCAGAWRYLIGDVIQFTKLEVPTIKITGRTKFFLNVAGSQLSEEKMDKAIVEVSNYLNVKVNEYVVGALMDEDRGVYHQWVIVSDDKINSRSFCDQLDETLKNLNKNYKVARTKALKGIEVKVIDKDLYFAYLDKMKKKGGQIKTPKVMKEKKMNKLLKFISE